MRRMLKSSIDNMEAIISAMATVKAPKNLLTFSVIYIWVKIKGMRWADLKSSKWLSISLLEKQRQERSLRVYLCEPLLRNRLCRILQMRLTRTRHWPNAWCAWLNTRQVRSWGPCPVCTSSIESVLISGSLREAPRAPSASSMYAKTIMLQVVTRWAPIGDNDVNNEILTFTESIND